MPRQPQWADEGTDPAGQFDDEIEEISADELAPSGGRGRAPIVLGDRAALAPADKTRVAHVSSVGPAAAGAEATMITGNPLNAGAARRQPLRGRLQVVAGKEQGRVVDLTDGSRVIGRSRDADVCLLDIQVSRRHAEVVADHNGVLIRDLGSGNGTMVNAQPITETRLIHGDEISVGDHLLRFEEEGPVANALAPVSRRPHAPAPAAPPMSGGLGAPAAGVPSVAAVRRARRESGGGKKKLMLAAVAMVAVLGVAFVAKVGMTPKQTAPQAEGPSQKMLAQKEFRAGLDLFKANDYEAAMAKFEAALAIEPRYDKAKEYQAATQREMGAKQAIGEGSRLLDTGDFDGARAAFSRVGTDSLHAKEAESGLAQVREAQAREAVQAGDLALEEENLDEARAAYDRALSISPGFTDAVVGIEKVNAKQEELRTLTAAEKRRRARERKARLRRERLRAKNAVRAALAPGENQFDKREFGKALSTFEDLAQNSPNSKVQRLARKKAGALKTFKPAYERGMAAVKARRADDAVKALSAAEVNAKAVSSGGAVHRGVQKELSDMLYLQGRVAFNAEKYGDAYQAWSKALRVNGSQKYARDGLRDLKNKGKEIYLEGYTQKTLNRAVAIRKFKLVTQMTPKDFEYHTKAKQQLESLAN